jgi:hypothetical protein
MRLRIGGSRAANLLDVARVYCAFAALIDSLLADEDDRRSDDDCQTTEKKQHDQKIYGDRHLLALTGHVVGYYHLLKEATEAPGSASKLPAPVKFFGLQIHPTVTNADKK